MRWPQLARRHPMFFLSFCGVTFHHAWMCITQFAWERRYANPGLVKVFDLMPIHAWAACSGCVAALLLGGLLIHWPLARVGLVLGLFLTVLRVVLIESGPVPGGGFGVWIVLVTTQLAQLIEPPMNPLTASTP